MATKKDLVEAHAFSRRRLVTAFLSGAPGGREVEPARPGRTVVGGIALAVLLIAAAAIASVLASRPQEDWNQIGLVVNRDNAAPYVILKEEEHPTLVPVINITSAQLILGADVDPTYVDEEVIEDQTPGDPIGIFGAPQTLPRPHQFISSGWTACTDDGLGLHLDISAEPLTTAFPGRGLLVQAGEEFYVIARSSDFDDDQRAYRYPVPVHDYTENMLGELGLNQTANAMQVPESWVRLFPDGGPLGPQSFDIDGVGEKPNPEFNLPSEARVGDLFIDGDQAALLTRDGQAPLDPFALAVWRHSPVTAKGKQPNEFTGDIPPVPGAGIRHGAALWPDATLENLPGAACARLTAEPGEVPKVELVGDPQDEAVPDEQSQTGSRTTFSIDRGHGAFFRVGEWDEATSASAYVVDPRGFTYELVGADTLTELGYDDVGEPLVPDTWNELFKAGVALSTDAALCPPQLPDQDEAVDSAGVECEEPVAS